MVDVAVKTEAAVKIQAEETIATTATATTTKIISSEILERLSMAPTFRTTYNSSGMMKCAHCQSNLESNETIIQWEWLEFCNAHCFQSFILKYNDSGCTICSKDCDFFCCSASAHAFGNGLYLLCTDQCAKIFFDSTTFCKFCRRVDPANMLVNGFCQSICQQKFDALFTATTSSTEIKEICCLECNSTTNSNIRLLFAGGVYGFCSHRCYFYRCLQCELFPGM